MLTHQDVDAVALKVSDLLTKKDILDAIRFRELETKLVNTLQLAEVVARLFEADPHQFSTRPCVTCRAISGLLGRDFGCSGERKPSLG